VTIGYAAINNVTEPRADRVDVHAGAKQMDGGRMSERMGAHALRLQRGSRFGGLPHRARDQVVNAEAGHWLTANVAEDQFVSRAIEACAEQLAKNLRGVRPQRTCAGLATLPEEAHRRCGVERDGADGEFGSFGGASAGVVEEQEQSVIALALRASAIGHCEQRIDLGFLQVGHGGCRRSAQWDGVDLSSVLDELRHLAGDEAEERVDGCEALIAR